MTLFEALNKYQILHTCFLEHIDTLYDIDFSSHRDKVNNIICLYPEPYLNKDAGYVEQVNNMTNIYLMSTGDRPDGRIQDNERFVIEVLNKTLKKRMLCVLRKSKNVSGQYNARFYTSRYCLTGFDTIRRFSSENEEHPVTFSGSSPYIRTYTYEETLSPPNYNYRIDMPYVIIGHSPSYPTDYLGYTSPHYAVYNSSKKQYDISSSSVINPSNKSSYPTELHMDYQIDGYIITTPKE